MSLVIYSAPDIALASSPYRPTFLDCSSDTATIVRVIADVYVFNVVNTLVATLEKEPTLGTTDQFRIEVSDIQKKYLTSEFFETSSFLETHKCVLSAQFWYVLLWEVTEAGGVLTTTWADAGAGTGEITSGQYVQFNGVNQHLQALTDRYADGTTKKFLTNRPQNSKIVRTQIYHCGILPQAESYDGGLFIEEFDGVDGTGSSLNTANSVILAATYKKLSFTMDASQLNAATKSVRYYIENGAAAQITEYFTVNVVDECDDTVNMYWQNHWGEFDQYFFQGNQTEKTRNKTKQITNRLNLSFNSYDRGTVDINRTNIREFEVFTETEKPEVITWLAEIGESVDVFIMVGTDRVPVNIKSVSSNIDNTEDGIYQIAIKYTLSNERILQLG